MLDIIKGVEARFGAFISVVFLFIIHSYLSILEINSKRWF